MMYMYWVGALEAWEPPNIGVLTPSGPGDSSSTGSLSRHGMEEGGLRTGVWHQVKAHTGEHLAAFGQSLVFVPPFQPLRDPDPAWALVQN